MKLKEFFLYILFSFIYLFAAGQNVHSVARRWNELLLTAIRNDLARPTVHARNLFHTSVLMYDSWAVYDDTATPFFLGKTWGDYSCDYLGFTPDRSRDEAVDMTISYAVYRLLLHRFSVSPGASEVIPLFYSEMVKMGYDPDFESVDYTNGNPAALGNYLAGKMIDFGRQDGSNEFFNYTNSFYSPLNPPLDPTKPGNPDLIDPNRWQPLNLENFIDQSGNPIAGTTTFLSPEWGYVTPFALTENQKSIYSKDGHTYWVYLDTGTPPLIGSISDEAYKWGFLLTLIWSSHLDPSDDILLDISPRKLGNSDSLPNQYENYPQFYNLLDGGEKEFGHSVNPYTGQAYSPNLVRRGDYTRVLAEFWADGPDSETPPGHWFSLLNYVSDHPDFSRKYRGAGDPMDRLEWEVKSYFTLGGAMHDAAITAWGLKGWYDYIRPVSAIRFMGSNGQSTSPSLPSYHPQGLPLIEGFVELVTEGDPLVRENPLNINKIKVKSWRGPDYISNPETSQAGVGWILAENWWPYQRPTFVTPPFAAFVSGHSTFSRAAAEVLTQITGDPYFPGGMGEFIAKKNEFLVFEEGPSEDVILQWATYRDASNQTSLSRIWGGIHAPADDIPGRKLGIIIGNQAVEKAEKYFTNTLTTTQLVDEITIYPNPTAEFLTIELKDYIKQASIELLDISGRSISKNSIYPLKSNSKLNLSELKKGQYILRITSGNTIRNVRILKQ